jgi:hypothetical protein
VDAAGVVADHAAEGAAAVGGGVGGEGEVEFARRRRGRGRGRSGLDAVPFDGVDRPMPFMYLEKSRMTAALQPWPASEVPAPRERMGASNWRQMGDGGDDVGFVARDDEADGDVAVVGGVGGVEGARAGVEADFAAETFGLGAYLGSVRACFGDSDPLPPGFVSIFQGYGIGHRERAIFLWR